MAFVGASHPMKTPALARTIHGDEGRRVDQASKLAGASALFKYWPRCQIVNRYLPLATSTSGGGELDPPA